MTLILNVVPWPRPGVIFQTAWSQGAARSVQSMLTADESRGAGSSRWVKYVGEREAFRGTRRMTRLVHYTTDTPIPEPASIPGKSHIFGTPPARPVGLSPARSTTIAAVIEQPQMAIMKPGRQAVSEALPQSWQRCSRQALVRRMS
jgi:hypothetical protein